MKRASGFLLGLALLLLGAGAWTASSSQAVNRIPPATATNARSFAFIEIVKPAHTPLPILTGTPAPLFAEIPIPTPQTVAGAAIVAPSGRASAAELQAQSPINYTGGKRILVDISEQHMYVYEDGSLVFSFTASTGMNNATRAGSFSVLDKIPNAYGATWNIWMPNWLGIYWAGSLENGIHALPILPNGATLWAGFLGRPISYGCIVLDTYDSQLLYDWAETGVPVEIQR